MRFDFFKCPICGGTESAPTTDGVLCGNCSHSFPVVDGIPVLIKDWQIHQSDINQLAEIKPDWYITEQVSEDASPWRHNHRKRRIYVENRLAAWFQSKGSEKANRLLDLGCGDGNHLSYLRKFSNEIFGCDYNLIRLVRSSLRFPSAIFFLADLLTFPSKPDFYDIIFCNHVIEHIQDDLTALRNIYSTLKPGGLLILGTPNEGAAWWQFAYHIQPSMRNETDHVQFYTAGNLGDKMEKAGFHILEIKHIGWGPPHFTLDSKIRRYKTVDDAFEFVGKILFPKQASSLYILATRE